MEKELRKQQNILGISGLAVIAFGLWSLLKMIVFAIATPGGFSEVIGIGTVETDGELGLSVYVIAAVIALLVDFAVRFLIGFSARAESKGKKKSIFYLLAAGFLVLLSVMSIITTFTTLFVSSLLGGVVAIIVELTSLFAYLEVIISSVKCRKLRKKLAAEE